LCSDGLSGQVFDAEIGTLASSLPPAEACRVLVGLANLRGGPDNITVLIVQVHEKSHSAKPHGAGGTRSPRLPWPMVALLLGVLLAAGAGLLTSYSIRPWNLTVFGLAATAILTGLAGLMVFYNQEKRRLADEPEP